MIIQNFFRLFDLQTLFRIACHQISILRHKRTRASLNTSSFTICGYLASPYLRFDRCDLTIKVRALPSEHIVKVLETDIKIILLLSCLVIVYIDRELRNIDLNWLNLSEMRNHINFMRNHFLNCLLIRLQKVRI
jgi:hypothetical protein